MKKFIPALFLLALLAACGKKPDPLKKEPMHFAALMAADDLVQKGEKSDYAALLPTELKLATHAMDTEKMVLEYAENPRQAEKHYLERLHNRLQMDGTVDVGTDYRKNQFEYIGSGKEPVKGYHYTVKLHAEFDTDFYPNEAYPKVAKKAPASVICSGAQAGMPTSISEHDNELRVEVFFTKCILTQDVVKSRMEKLTPALEASLGDIYAGKTPVTVSMANDLASLHASGTKQPPNSVCLTGGYEACMARGGKHRKTSNEEVKKERLAAMQIVKGENGEKK